MSNVLIVAQRDDTLTKISSFANDVEMQVCLYASFRPFILIQTHTINVQEPVNAAPTLYLVLDTNVLIDNLDTIRRFSDDLDNITLPWSIKIVVPSVVLSELDGCVPPLYDSIETVIGLVLIYVCMGRLKNREGLSWFARTASTFLLQKVQEKKSLKVQARSETLGTKTREYEYYHTADIAILDCCLYYKTMLRGEVILLSNDTNLRILCENEEFST
jgi:rRNA-processing protein FCF1